MSCVWGHKIDILFIRYLIGSEVTSGPGPEGTYITHTHIRTINDLIRISYGPYTDPYGPYTDLIRTLYEAYTDLIRIPYGPYTKLIRSFTVNQKINPSCVLEGSLPLGRCRAGLWVGLRHQGRWPA